tara:strand:- start:965 stop:1282 length:318 start_codon:yes stop_codon:yes gene_type:complete
MKVKLITKHTYNGKEYNSLKEIKEEIHNNIGLEVLDKIARVCPLEKHKDYIKLLDLLCSKEIRDILVQSFTVTYEEPSGEHNFNCEYNDNCIDDEYKEVNILDVN